MNAHILHQLSTYDSIPPVPPLEAALVPPAAPVPPLDAPSTWAAPPVVSPDGWTQLSAKPRLYVHDNFLTETETESLITFSRDSLRTANTAGGFKPKVRSAMNARLPADAKLEDPILKRLSAKLTAAARMNTENAEPLHVARYVGSKDFYHAHFDSSKRRPRLATVMAYLNDVEAGGETVFPRLETNLMAGEDLPDVLLSKSGRARRSGEQGADHAGEVLSPGMGGVSTTTTTGDHLHAAGVVGENGVELSTAGENAGGALYSGKPCPRNLSFGEICNSRCGLRVQPKRGRALLWYNHDSRLRHEPDSLHLACPPAVARAEKPPLEKWIATRWLRNYAVGEGGPNGYDDLKTLDPQRPLEEQTGGLGGWETCEKARTSHAGAAHAEGGGEDAGQGGVNEENEVDKVEPERKESNVEPDLRPVDAIKPVAFCDKNAKP